MGPSMGVNGGNNDVSRSSMWRNDEERIEFVSGIHCGLGLSPDCSATTSLPDETGILGRFLGLFSLLSPSRGT